MRKCGETERRATIKERAKKQSGERGCQLLFHVLFAFALFLLLLCHYREKETGDGCEYASFDHIFHKISFDLKKRFLAGQKNNSLHQLINAVYEMGKNRTTSDSMLVSPGETYHLFVLVKAIFPVGSLYNSISKVRPSGNRK